MKWSAVGTGAMGGAGFALPLLAIFYLLRQVAKLSFPPFDLFDWMARRLPGPVVTFGIDLMVSVLRLLPVGETSAAAKNAEQLLALGMFVLVCALAGAFLYAWLDRPSPLHPAYSGAALGGALGVCLGAVAASISRPGAGAGIGYFLGVVVLLAAWGAVLGWSFPRLLPRQPARPAGEASAAGPVVEAISRRRFILRVGEATATITVLGAGLGALVADRRSRSAGAAAGVPWSERNALPNAADPVQPAPGTRPELT
ncbi:MAG: molybdopterin-binding oxidoreductase, partial [Gemmatimonadetes bacterium]|nr:molybdopterin-binding oxidoreductase [Gemmatimonadota bacterium]